MIGEWELDEKLKADTLESENKIAGFIINKLQELCYPAEPGAPRPVFPEFPLKVCITGKPFAGKTSALKIVEQGKKKKPMIAQNKITHNIA
jgi:hypothetical protein